MIYVGNASKMKLPKMKMETGFFQRISNKKNSFGMHFGSVETNYSLHQTGLSYVTSRVQMNG